MKKKSTLLFVIVTMMFLMTAFSLTAGEMTGKNGQGNVAGTQAMDSPLNASFFGKIPLYFIPNKGQVNDTAVFYAKASRYTLWVTRDGLVYDSHRKNEGNTFQRDVYRQTFLNASKNPEIVGLDKTRHRVNYYKGNDRSKWITGLHSDKAILYKSLYKNIDLKVYGIEKEVEYDWMVHPNGNPENIRFRFDNALKTSVDKAGNLVIKTTFGELSHKKPISFQVIDGKKVEVNAEFKKIRKNVYGFEIGKYNKNHTLIIDPLVLVYSTYFGGSGTYEYFAGYTTDQNGLFYITGATTSAAPDFPISANPYDGQYSGGAIYDAFVTVIDTTQSGSASLHYSTYLGDDGVDSVYDIDVDEYGSVYLTGFTSDSTPPDHFPTTDSSSPTPGGSYDVFVCKLDIDEYGYSNLAYSTLFGGDGEDKGRCIVLGSNNQVYVTGHTTSGSGGNYPFPITQSTAYRTDKIGIYDFFLAKLTIGSGITYCTYFGGETTANDEVDGDYPRIALGMNDIVFLVGETGSQYFPVKPSIGALKTTPDTSSDGFISVFDTTQSGENGLVYSSYFGGTGNEFIKDIHARTEAGKDAVYITGYTSSSAGTYSFPITSENGFPISDNPYSGTLNGDSDAFVTKLYFEQGLMTILYSTYIGGSATDEGNAITVDEYRNVYVAGKSLSPNFPYKYEYQTCSTAETYNAFVSMLDLARGPGGMIFSTCLGGNGIDSAQGIGVDSSGNVLIGGSTFSTSSNPFPTSVEDANSDPPTHAPLQTGIKGQQDGFITKLYLDEIPNINLTSPIGDETWRWGESQTITWDYSGIADNVTVDILLMQDGSVIGTIADDILISNGSGSFVWTVGFCIESITVNTGDDYKVKIITSDEANFDLSDADFTIIHPIITVTSPNGGEYWRLGTTQTITWTAVDLSDTVKITLWKDGVVAGTIASDLDATTGSYSWNVGTLASSTAPAGTGYTIKIKEKGTMISDFSDAPFRIFDLEVTAPNGGELWKSGAPRNITWNAQGITENMRIQLVNGDNSTITYSVDPAAGSFSWTVASLADGSTASPASGYTIKIRPIGLPIADASDATFTICDLTLTAPNGGETWDIGTTQNITWTSSAITTGTVKITLWDSVTYIGEIVSGIDVSLGTYSWTVGTHGGGTAPAGMYTIKIKLQGEDIPDYSDEVFHLN